MGESNYHSEKNEYEVPDVWYNLYYHADVVSCRSEDSEVVEQSKPNEDSCKGIQVANWLFIVLSGAIIILISWCS